MAIDVSKTLLLIVDVQNDFCPGGALGVKDGDKVITPINNLSRMISLQGGKTVATQDWHPPKHVSFASVYKNKNPGDIVDTPLVKAQVLWPDHCVQGTQGAALHPELDIKYYTWIMRKGMNLDLDSYSVFFENDRKTPTGLEGIIKYHSIDTVIIAGLATDYCVFNSAVDARQLRLNTIVVNDAIRGVDIPAGSVDKAITMMKAYKVEFRTSDDLLDDMRKW